MPYDDVYGKVVEEYKRTGSVKRTAQNVGTTLVRAQRILITEGLWSSQTSSNVCRLYAEGKNVEQIAAALFISIKTVQAYLPYTRIAQGYGGEDRSADAVRAEGYRDRMHQAAERQVDQNVFHKESGQMVDNDQNCEMHEEDGEMNERIDQQNALPSALPAESNQTSNAVEMQENDAYHCYLQQSPAVLQLTLELEMPYVRAEDMRILQQYGKVNRGITRKVLVPADITLHALHYVIMRTFGWENSHLHHYLLPGEIFNWMTGGNAVPDRYGYVIRNGSILRWAQLCGIYFRFPSDDFDDIYWDDDYEEGISFRTWLRKKYTGPYRYDGYGEHYHHAHREAQAYVQSKPRVRSGEETIADVELGFETRMDELLERLRIRDILIPIGIGRPEDLEYQIARLARSYEHAVDPEWHRPLPVTNELRYTYDYGDGWQVRIRMEDYYTASDDIPMSDICNRQGIRQIGILASQIQEVQMQHRPMCISLDGLPLMDDVGGVHGYINFLETIHEGDPDEAQEYRTWARSMGWTGRMSRPENLLR